MASEAEAGARRIYASPNGDRWYLLRDAEHERCFVRHIGNPASGGHVTDIGLSAFLAADRGAPEHRELWRLIDTLIDGDARPQTAVA